ncbi:protein UPSTREAM OF FLC-like, partial [Glycine soja]|uniref:protein SOSEKI 2-like n=1 Tax=Glycine max TaxID=3847 RepID=UPI000E21B8B6
SYTLFVWHDLCEDDLILPTHGNEYVLKGSKLFDESNSDCFSPISKVKTQSVKLLSTPASSWSLDEGSSSSSLNRKKTRISQDDELSQDPHIGSSNVSPESRAEKSDALSLALIEYKIYETDGLADASTKTKTLEYLIRADASKVNNFRILEEEGMHMSTNTRMKASNLLMQLISCGSILVKNHSFGLIPSYKPMFYSSKCPFFCVGGV